jgi:hypothetical protein
MKKLFFVLALFIGLVTAKAQTGPVAQVATITQLKNYNGPSGLVFVSDSAKQGLYYICAACTADESLVYAGAGGKKWRRVVDYASLNGISDIDTTSLSNRINLKVNISDTAAALLPYLRKIDTASLSNRINLKVNISDTANALAPYLREIDTASLSNRINLKVNISDTAAALSPYARKASPVFTGIVSMPTLDLSNISTPSSPSSTDLRLWTETEGGFQQLHFKDATGIDHEVTRDNLHVVRNNTGSTISKGKWVYITGSTGVFPTVALAQANSANTTPAVGIVVSDIANNSFGQIMTMGDAQNINTSAFVDGDVLYLSPSSAGDATTTRATGANQDQRLGVVVKSNASSGIVHVMVGPDFDPTALNLKVNISDTAAALLPYLRKIDTTSMLSPYLRKVDTASLSNRVDAKANLDGGNTWTNNQLFDSIAVSILKFNGTPAANKILMDADGDGYFEPTSYSIPVPDGNYGDVDVNGGSWTITSSAKDALAVLSQELKNKTINGDSNTISNLTASMFKAGEIVDLDQDLQDIGALSTSSGDFLIKGASAWEKKTTAETKTILGIVTPLSTITDGSTAPVESNAIFDALALKANLASPALTGTPTAPTATATTNTTQVATTAFVHEAVNDNEMFVRGIRAFGSPIIAETLASSYRSSASATALTDGNQPFQSLYLPEAATLTGIGFQVEVQGVYTADNNNKVGLYTLDTASGAMALVASSANNGDLYKAAANTIVTAPFTTPYVAAAGTYYVSFLYNNSASTTPPQLVSAAGDATRLPAFNFSNSIRFYGHKGSQADMATPTNVNTLSANNNNFWMFVY